MKKGLSSFTKPRPLEYPEHFRPGMGTETVGPFLRSFVQLVRPNRILEVGAGYTTPFLLEALINNENVFDDGNLDAEYFKNYEYDPRLVIIDDMSLGDILKRPGMEALLGSEYVEFVEGKFQGRAEQVKNEYGDFDFVWFDCGDTEDYRQFIQEYWPICTGHVIFHYTYSDGKPNANLITILKSIENDPFKIDIVEPHKMRQGSITIINKKGQ